DPMLAGLFDGDKSDYAIAYARRQWRVAWLSAARKLWLASIVVMVGTSLESWKVVLSAGSVRTLASYAIFLMRDRLVVWGFGGMVMWLASYRPKWLVTPGPESDPIVTAFMTAAVPLIILAGAWLVARGLCKL